MNAVAGLLAACGVVLAFRPAGAGRRRRPVADPPPTDTYFAEGSVRPGPTATWAAALSRQLRAGATLRGALTTVNPSEPRLAHATVDLRRSLARGDDVAVALDGLQSGDAHVGFVRSVLSACATVGGPSAEPLDRAAAALRGRAADLEERSAQSAQARSSARVMTLLPIGALGFLVAGDPGVRAVMASPTGLVLLCLGGAANVAGWWWMGRIVRSHEWAG